MKGCSWEREKMELQAEMLNWTGGRCPGRSLRKKSSVRTVEKRYVSRSRESRFGKKHRYSVYMYSCLTWAAWTMQLLRSGSSTGPNKYKPVRDEHSSSAILCSVVIEHNSIMSRRCRKEFKIRERKREREMSKACQGMDQESGRGRRHEVRGQEDSMGVHRAISYPRTSNGLFLLSSLFFSLSSICL